MTARNTTKARRDTVHVRISQADRSLIDRAAESVGMTRANFILHAAQRAAEETLLNRVLTAIRPDAYDEFLKRLDRPMQPNERLQHTMRAKAPWQTA